MLHEIMVTFIFQICLSAFSEQVTHTHVSCDVPRTNVPRTDVTCADVPWTQTGGDR